MKRYAKVINDETKEVSVFLGTDFEWSICQGYEEMEVEQAYNGSWYVLGYVPEKPLPTNEEQRISRANAYSELIDPLHSQKQRRTILGTWTEEDEADYVAKVKELSEQVNNDYPYMENE